MAIAKKELLAKALKAGLDADDKMTIKQITDLLKSEDKGTMEERIKTLEGMVAMLCRFKNKVGEAIKPLGGVNLGIAFLLFALMPMLSFGQSLSTTNFTSMNDGQLVVHKNGNVTIEGTVIAEEVSAGGENVVVSPAGYSGTGVKVQFGTVPTNATGTITFADVFTATPSVVMGAEADPSTNAWFVSGLTTSNFVYTKTAGVLGGYIAVGLK